MGRRRRPAIKGRPALLRAQQDAVNKAELLKRDAIADLVLVLCTQCRTKQPLAKVYDVGYTGPEGNSPPGVPEIRLEGGTWHELGAVVEVRRRTLPERRRGKTPTGEFYVALLEIPSAKELPDTLPVWCSRHGEGAIHRGRLTETARKARRMLANTPPTQTVEVRVRCHQEHSA